MLGAFAADELQPAVRAEEASAVAVLAGGERISLADTVKRT